MVRVIIYLKREFMLYWVLGMYRIFSNSLFQVDIFGPFFYHVSGLLKPNEKYYLETNIRYQIFGTEYFFIIFILIAPRFKNNNIFLYVVFLLLKYFYFLPLQCTMIDMLDLVCMCRFI